MSIHPRTDSSLFSRQMNLCHRLSSQANECLTVEISTCGRHAENPMQKREAVVFVNLTSNGAYRSISTSQSQDTYAQELFVSVRLAGILEVLSSSLWLRPPRIAAGGCCLSQSQKMTSHTPNLRGQIWEVSKVSEIWTIWILFFWRYGWPPRFKYED